MSAREFLENHLQLFIRQRKEWIEIVVDWETVNQYVILDRHQNSIGYIAERGGSFVTKLKRFFLRSHRPLEIDVFNEAKEPILHLKRDFFWFFSDLSVSIPAGPDSKILGSVHRRFGIIYKRYDLRDENNAIFATIRSPIWRIWTFPFYDLNGKQKGVVSKKWGGALREIFTDADTYLVDFNTTREISTPEEWTWEQKATLLCAAISIDFDFFENNQGRQGLLDIVTPD